jgi:formate C-acetyltransferase
VEHLARQCIELSNMGVAVKSANLAKLVRMPLTEACLERGLDPDNGGPLYGFGEIETVGIGAAADALTAIRRMVFEQKRIDMAEMIDCLDSNFEGREPVRRMLLEESPKYGNDDAEADRMAARVAEHFWEYIGRFRSPRGGAYYGATALLTRGVTFGKRTGALPDGKLAGEPLGNSVGPRTGVDTNGPTAMLRSAARVPQHLAVGGPTCNLRLTRSLLGSAALRDKAIALINGYFAEGGMMVQITPVDRETLLEAQRDPERYRDLIVRVGGFSAKFVELDRDIQNDIISRG